MAVLFLMNPPSPDRTPYLNELADLGLDFEVIYVPIGPDEHGWGEFELRHPHRLASSTREAAVWAASRIREGSIDILVCYGYRTLPFATALIAARAMGVQVVVRADTNIDAIRAESWWKRSARRAVARTLIPRDALAWAIGSKNDEFWRSEVRLHRRSRIPLEVLELPGGAEPRHRSQDERTTLRLLYVGRLAVEKRVEDLICAALSLPASITWELAIVGDGPQRTKLEALANSDARISFFGAVPHSRLGPFFASADTFVLPSGFEPWGLVVNEALGFGLYTITSDAVGAAHDLIVRGVNGDIFPVADRVALGRVIQLSLLAECPQPTPPRTDTSCLILESIHDLRLRD